MEHDAQLVTAAADNMTVHGIAPERYRFVLGDMFERLPELGQFDVVFCFGILYHINDHMRLLSAIAEREPCGGHRRLERLAHVRSGGRGASAARRQSPAAGRAARGLADASALDAMLASLGWTFEYFDWLGSGLADAEKMDDYRAGRRVSALVTGNDRIPPEVREAGGAAGVRAPDRPAHAVDDDHRDRGRLLDVAPGARGLGAPGGASAVGLLVDMKVDM